MRSSRYALVATIRLAAVISLSVFIPQTDLHVPFRPKSTSAEDISKLYKPADHVRLPPVEKLALFRDLVVGARAGKVRVTEAVSEV